MIGRLLPLLVLALGCQTTRDLADVARTVEGLTLEVASARPAPVPGPATTTIPFPADRLDLPTLWGLALGSNPALREAVADVEAARGRQVQAGLYPNPRVLYTEDTIGSRAARQGNISIQASQEILTAGKFHLDRAVAGQETASATVGLVGKRFDILTRIRRAYYDYLALHALAQLNGVTVASLEKGVEITRQQVEKAKTRPLAELLRLEALLEEARINQARAQSLLEGAWRQLAAEVGLPGLQPPATVGTLAETPPSWTADPVLQRVLTTNTAVRQAGVEAERARLTLQRARAGAFPNITVSAGYTADNVDQTAGGQISVEVPLPLWNRQQGTIHEAEARLASAQAAIRTVETRLARDTAEAFARYQAASSQVERLATEVLPRLQQSLELLRKAYQAGSAQTTFSDLLLTEQNLNTTRLTLAEARRSLWQAIADLEGLMQLDVEVNAEKGCP
jgi:cobalt-zinc-cadmium efflux system outer membrane protein